MTKGLYAIEIPCVWMAYVPADKTHSSTWYDLLQIREFSFSTFDEKLLIQVVWKNGDKSKFLGDRAKAVHSEFNKFKDYLEGKREGDRQ